MLYETTLSKKNSLTVYLKNTFWNLSMHNFIFGNMSQYTSIHCTTTHSFYTRIDDSLVVVFVSGHIDEQTVPSPV